MERQMCEQEQSETRLIAGDVLSAKQVERLGGFWITTVEQLVSQAAAEGGAARLAEAVEMDQGTFAEFLAALKSKLPPEKVAELEAPAPTDKGMGALRPPECP